MSATRASLQRRIAHLEAQLDGGGRLAVFDREDRFFNGHRIYVVCLDDERNAPALIREGWKRRR